MFMRILILLIAVSISCMASSQERYPLIDPQRIDIPTCEVFSEVVDFRTAPTANFAAVNKMLAFSWRSANGKLTVYVDDSNFFSSRITPEWQRFILYHECGHHVLGHAAIMAGGVAYQGDEKEWEHKADCYAIKRLKEDGYSEDDLNTVLQQAGDINLVASLTPLSQYGPVGMDAHKFNVRTAKLKQCIENANVR